MLDLLIAGGDVIDGTGRAAFRADVGIRDGRIVEIGRITQSARQPISAEGQVVAPGFIDVHTHYDVQGFWDPYLSPSPLHGVTTVLGGNCGFTVAPLSPSSSTYLMRMLARVEGMPLTSLEQGVPWDWRTTAEFLDRLEGRLAVNAGFMVGHSAIRREAMGEAATARHATQDELTRMRQLLRAGLEAGALGFSSSWSAGHQDADGAPVPSRHAAAGELIALAEVCGEYPGTSLEYLPLGQGGPFPDHVVELMVAMTVAAQRPLNWNLLAVTASTMSAWEQKLHVGDLARARGGKVIGLALPEVPKARFTFQSGFVLDGLPGWSEVLSLPEPARLARLADPAVRRRLDAQAQRSGPLRHMADWGTKYIAETFTTETAKYAGRLVHEIALAEGKYPFDALLDIVCADSLRTAFTNEPAPDTAADWKARASVLRDPRAMVGASDAGAHLDMLATFSYSTALLAAAVREQQVLTLPEAVQMLTSQPARLYGLVDRGVIAAGAAADLVVFDPLTVASEPVRTVSDLPGGMPRLYAGAIGISSVLVNGTVIVADGGFTGEIAGQILRSGKDTATPDLT